MSFEVHKSGQYSREKIISHRLFK